MTGPAQDALLRLLAELAEGKEEPTAALAEGLKRLAGSPARDLDGPEALEVKERISALIDPSGAAAVAVVQALVGIDTAIAARGLGDLPFATRFAPLALERALHAGEGRWQEETARSLASRSPIWSRDRKALVAAPVGPLGEEGAERFADRVLREAARLRPKRVVLILGGLGEGGAPLSVWDNLEKDLSAQGIALERRDDLP